MFIAPSLPNTPAEPIPDEIDWQPAKKIFSKNQIVTVATVLLLGVGLVMVHYRTRKKIAPALSADELALIQIIKSNADHILKLHQMQKKIVKLDDYRK